MSVLTPTRGAGNVSGATVLRAAAALTTSYVATNSCTTIGFNRAVFGLGYVKGSGETNVQIKFEGYDGTTWRALGYAEVPSSGVRELTKQVVQLTPANFDADDAVLTPPMDCSGCQEVRASVKQVGGTPGTLAVSVSFSNEANA